MDQPEMQEQSLHEAVETNDAPSIASPFGAREDTALFPQSGGGSCGCGGGSSPNPANGGAVTYPLVYAMGRIQANFPSLGVEKEYSQAVARSGATGNTDQQTFHSVLSQKRNRYLARKLCWVLSIQEIPTYILLARDPCDIDVLVESIRPAPSPMDLDIVIGIRGPVAPPEMCNGLMVPIVVFDLIYSFNRDALIKAIPRPDTVPAKQEDQFRASAREVLDRILQITDNAGATDEHRALNYLAVQYPAIYARATEQYTQNFSLTAVEARHSLLSGVRKIVDVIFSFTHRETDFTEKYFVRVDVTEEFPFLVTKLSPYYDR